MDNFHSISKGCFAFGPARPSTSKKGKTKHKVPITPESFFADDIWKKNFSRVWGQIEKQLNNIEENAADSLLTDLVRYIEDSPHSDVRIPTAAVLTGVNLPDHGSLFRRLESRLKQKLAVVSVALVDGSDCSSLRHLVERTVLQLIGSGVPEKDVLLLSDDDDDDKEEATKVTSRDQCNLPFLVEHFRNITINGTPSPTKRMKNNVPKIIVILKDFETLASSIVNRYIQILSAYRDRLPFVLVFGVATSVSALADVLDHKSISRLSIKSFEAETSVHYLNRNIDEVFLNANCPFQLSGKLCTFFTEVFLYYDFSVNRFTQGIKYCALEHFMNGGRVVGLLCSNENDLEKNIMQLTEDDIIQIRMIPSFSVFTKQNYEVDELEDLEFAKKIIFNQMVALRINIKLFYVCLKLLHILVEDLPRSPLGKTLRDLYIPALTKNDITVVADYKECRLLLGFMGRDQLIKKLNAILELLKGNRDAEHIKDKLKELKNKVLTAGMSPTKKSPVKKHPSNLTNLKSRDELKKQVMEMGKSKKVKSEYEETRETLIDYLMMDVFPTVFRKMSSLPLREIVYLDDAEAIRLRVVPRVRASIHAALTNPAHYLTCSCCRLDSDTDILPTMPDVCIAFKLHLESGTVINMYDWLQSFNMIIKGAKEIEADDKIDPEIQARFAQAVADLEFLGFIKSSTKADHVVRLTWG